LLQDTKEDDIFPSENQKEMISLLGSQSDTFISNATLFVLGNFEGTLGLSVRPKSMSEKNCKVYFVSMSFTTVVLFPESL